VSAVSLVLLTVCSYAGLVVRGAFCTLVVSCLLNLMLAVNQINLSSHDIKNLKIYLHMSIFHL
jgi:hypothetical protein